MTNSSNASDDKDVSERSTTNRRRFLRTTGVVAAAGVLGGAATTSAAATTGSYSKTVDLKAKGADPTGNRSIVPLLRKYAGDDTLIKLPQGRYRMDQQFRLTGFSNFGIVGNGATIVPDNYYNFDGISCFLLGTYYDPGRDLEFSGLTFDNTAADTGVRAIQAQVADGLHVSDIEYKGVHDSGNWGPALFDVTDPNGTGVIDAFHAPDGGEYTDYTPGDVMCGPIGCLTSRYNEGTLTYKHCNFSNFPNNGIYAGNSKGQVHIVGGVYENNDVSNLRIGGDGSSIKWAQVNVKQPLSESVNQVGIRLDKGSNLQVEGTVLRMLDPSGDGIVVHDPVDSATISNTSLTLDGNPVRGINVSSGVGSLDITDVDITAKVSSNAVFLRPKSSAGGNVTCKRLSISGDATGAPFRNAILCKRDGSKFVDLDVDQPGTNYRRAIEIAADNVTIDGGTYKAYHHPIIVAGDGATVENVDLAESYQGYQGIKAYSGSSGLSVTNSRIVGGILNASGYSITEWGDTWQ